MKIFKLLFSTMLLLVVNSFGLFAQAPKSFSSDKENFLLELRAYLETSDKKESELFMLQFTTLWNSDTISEDDRQMIYRHSNIMLKKRIKPVPEITNYFYAIITFVKNPDVADKYESWKTVVEKLISASNLRHFNRFVDFSLELIKDKRLYSSPSTTWIPSTDDYKIDMDSLPKVVFQQLDLKCLARGDSAVIYGTTGIYYPTAEKWIGSGGKVDWTRAGFNENEVYAKLKDYTINFKSPNYKADSVEFYYPQFFSQPLLGSLEDKILADVTEDKASYPKFDSYDKRLVIKNIAENVDYDGGFSVRGARIIASGNAEEDAYLTFKRNDTLFLKIASKSYSIRKDRISSQRASATIYIKEDSIYHPGLVFSYIVESKEVSLVRNDEGMAKSPFYNTYHGLDMYFEALIWKTNEPLMEMKVNVGSKEGSAIFESSNYYRNNRFLKIQGMDEVHPLMQLKNFTKSQGSNEFYANDLAIYMGFSLNQLKPVLINLANQGFINYNVDNEKVIVKDRTFDYILYNAGKKDYDAIDYQSTISAKSNATLDLLSYEMTIRGVPEILLSDSQDVYVYPGDQEIKLKKNRDFDFGGKMRAGKLTFYGKKFEFKYDEFKIKIVGADSLQLRAESKEPDANGEFPLVLVKTVIQNIEGDLYIDKPFNKSGIQNFPEYPIFNSTASSYVYYDDHRIQNGVYLRDNFYFQIKPFVIDSIDNFNNQSLEFDGDFSSAGIFPDFPEKLSMQPDYSLGFKRKTPPEGYPIYGGKGVYTNDILLSNQGLRGNGVLKYLTSTTESNDFIFLPDSTRAVAQKFDLQEQANGAVEYPMVKAEGVFVLWKPAKDTMHVEQVEKPLSFYNGQSELFGSMDLTPHGLTGSGRMNFEKSELEAKLIKFKQSEFQSDTADFRLKAVDISGIAFSTVNVNSRIDFKERIGEFKSNGGGSFVTFPVNQYVCYMEQFKWFMDEDKLEMSAGSASKQETTKPVEEMDDLDLSGSEFISVHPKQDSLSFVAPTAKYDLKKYIIEAADVKYINVADARIFPDKGNVVVEKKAVMQTLENANILANNATRYHKIYNASVNVYGKKSYTGSGDYDYTDEINRKQKIHYDVINVDTSGQTYAEGAIPESANFTLSPYFAYRGNVRMNANSPDLTFTGAAQLQHSCGKEEDRVWFRFSAEINPEDIYIPIDSTLKDVNNEKITSSINLTKDSMYMYAAFPAKKHSYSDIQILKADGFIYFDKASREYKVSNKEKIRERSQPGNYISLHNDNCNVYGEGKINLGTDLGQVKLTPIGSIELEKDTSAVFNLMLGIDFFFDENLMNQIAEEFQMNTTFDPLNFSSPVYERGLKEYVGKEEADKLISQLTLYGSLKRFPSEMAHTLLFSDLKMVWNSKLEAYVSEGDLGLSNIHKKEINKMIEGKIQISKKRGGDEIDIYFQMDETHWYYFNYTRSLMQVISSDEVFNTAIREMKSSKRESKAEKGQVPYSFVLAGIRKKTDFLKRFEVEEEKEEEPKE